MVAEQNKVDTENTVILVGAGFTSLTTALILKEKGIPFKILEAASSAGGRAITHISAQGTPINKGANWFHGGKSNPLLPLIEKFGISYTDDQPGITSPLVAYDENGQHGKEFRSNLEKPKIGFKTASTLLGSLRRLIGAQFRLTDSPIASLGTTQADRDTIQKLQPLWLGTDQPWQSSAQEFLHDPGTPGGLQLEGGMQSLIDAMVKAIGKENIVYNCPITKISNTSYGAKVETKSGDIYAGKKVVFTGSVGVLKSGMIEFDPPHEKEMQDYLAGISMGTLAKIVLEVDKDFFAQRSDLKNMHVDLLDKDPPLFCHIHSNGQPTITLIAGGEAGVEMEKMTPEQALVFAKDHLNTVKELEGYEEKLIGNPLVTDWSQNPYTQCSYTALNTGHKRKRGLQEDNILYAGEGFDNLSPGTVAGAFRSGEYAASQLVKSLSKKNNFVFQKRKGFGSAL